MTEEYNRSRVEKRRQERARLRKKRRKRNVIIGLAVLMAISICVFLFGPWRSSGEKSSPGNEIAGNTSDIDSADAGEEGGDSETNDSRSNAEDDMDLSNNPDDSPVTNGEEENTGSTPSGNSLRPPTDGEPIHPFTRDESTGCGHWPSGSLDYPYFGAAREGTRLHGAIDIYPPGATAEDGGGQPVYAVKDGAVIRVIDNFYTRANGERTKALLIDHGDFVACYSEIRGQPNVKGSALAFGVGNTVAKGQVLGYISGTKQLHFEMYSANTPDRFNWYGEQPANLLDPTELMLDLYGLR